MTFTMASLCIDFAQSFKFGSFIFELFINLRFLEMQNLGNRSYKISKLTIVAITFEN